MFKNWFQKKDVHVADLEVIDLDPEFVIEPKTRREMYEDAVREVKMKRVSALMGRAIMDRLPDVDYICPFTIGLLADVLAEEYIDK